MGQKEPRGMFVQAAWKWERPFTTINIYEFQTTYIYKNLKISMSKTERKGNHQLQEMRKK